MILLADESVDGPIVKRLRREGHEVDYVAEMSPGTDDDVVMDWANGHRAILMTADKDFGELVYRQRRVYSGVILLRLAGLSSELKARVVAEALAKHGSEMCGAFAVISPGILRIREKIGYLFGR